VKAFQSDIAYYEKLFVQCYNSTSGYLTGAAWQLSKRFSEDFQYNFTEMVVIKMLVAGASFAYLQSKKAIRFIHQSRWSLTGLS
jgi:hypothetical protein